MKVLFSSSRLLLITLLILLFLSQAYASKSTWIGTDPSGSWSNSANWDNGVPSLTDSAVITGGNIDVNLNVLISSNVGVRHITIDNYCILSILQTVSLEATDAPGNAIRVEPNGSLLNFGSLDIFNAGNGIFNCGNFENYGNCIIGGTLNGLAQFGPASFSNVGKIEIMNSNVGLTSSTRSLDTLTTINTGEISITNCGYGIINDLIVKFQNNSTLSISNTAEGGISNSGTFINNGQLVLKDIGNNTNNSNFRIAIENYEITLQGTTYTGYYENNSNIVMSELKGSAIKNNNSATFLNSGNIFVQDALEYGLICMPISTFTNTTSGILSVSSTILDPLDIHEQGVFEIADGTGVTIRD